MINRQQKNLVDELAAMNPVLFATYKKTEEVAINHWYPGMAQSNGSVNSYPHVQGIINQLSLVIDYPQCAITLTDVELYLLLTSILLHDIGKVKQKKEHGAASRELIKEHWAELKIENEQIQYIIQNICYLHDRSTDDFPGAYQRLPVDEYIDRYGKVRPRLLGALLYLGDHMDNSYTRTIPEEFTNHFRKNVLGVHFQPEQQLITTVIHPEAFLHIPKKGEEKILYSLDYVQETMGPLGYYFKEKSEEIREHPEDQHAVDLEALLYLMRDTYDNDQCLSNIRNELYVLGMPIKKWMLECEGQLFLVQKRNKDTNKATFLSEDTLGQVISILRENPDSRKGNEKKRLLQPELKQVLGEIELAPNDSGNNLVKVYNANQEMGALAKIAETELDAAVALPHEKEALAAFQMFEICQHHVLKPGGDTTREIRLVPCYHAALSIEPLTGYEYCKRVLTAMYDITTTIFAKSFFSYTDICNAMREDPKNATKVMSSVRRLSYLFQYIAKNKIVLEMPKPMKEDTETSVANGPTKKEGAGACESCGSTPSDCHYRVYYDDCVWNIATLGEGNEDCGALKKTAPQLILGEVKRKLLVADWTEEVRVDDSKK